MIDPGAKEVDLRGGNAPGEIGHLHLEFIMPGAGAFGRDKSIEFRSATSAKARYYKDGKQVEEVVTPGQAQALYDAAEVAGKAMAERQAQSTAAAQADAADVQQKLANLSCPICGGTHFDRQTSREDGQWAMTSFRMQLLICTRCAYVMQFALGRSMYVPN